MLLSIVLWILFGALAGWIASIITGANRQIGAVGNIRHWHRRCHHRWLAGACSWRKRRNGIQPGKFAGSNTGRSGAAVGNRSLYWSYAS